MNADDELDRGVHAFGERRWADARRALADVPPEELDAQDLERLAVASFLTGDDERSIAAWAAAHQRRRDDGELARAARCAFWLGFQLANRGDMAQAGGWFGRAQHLVDEVGDCAESGYLLIPTGLQALGERDPDRARECFTAAADAGRRFDEVDLSTLGRLGTGQALIISGDPEEGMRILDEAMIAVVSDEVSPTVAGIVYCAVIEACQLTFEMRRAHEWTDALTRWCDQQPDLVPYRGQCLVHRAEIMRLHGAWNEALDEVLRACDRLSEPAGQPALGAAHYQRAELHRLRGEFDDAADAYAMASQWGHDPQPGLAMLRLAEGNVDAAAAAIRRVEAETHDRSARAPVLAAAVQILLAAGDVAEAAHCARELDELASARSVAYLRAMADDALGAVCLAEDDATSALGPLRRATDGWNALGARYDAARTRVLIARTCQQLGDADTAEVELAVARRVFEELGAAPDLSRTGESAGPVETTRHGLTARELEVLSHLSAGSTNKAIAAELVLSERTVERHVSNIFAKLGVSTRAAATAFAHRHGMV
ncbi:MAG: LuxR C-terminal-related transcriptional regulator [Acidimicrobiales bacterium]